MTKYNIKKATTEGDKNQWGYELPPNRNESNQNENVCSWQPHGIIPQWHYPSQSAPSAYSQLRG